MYTFAYWLIKRGWFQVASGACFAVREIVGGIVYCEQTTYPTAINSGGAIPRYSFLNEGGIFSMVDKTPNILRVELRSSVLNATRQIWADESGLSYTLSPASIAAGATLSDMTNATAEDSSNVFISNQYRSLLGLSPLA